jgi:hypothetical protein
MRTAFSMLLGALLVTGCIFPSFDDMQNGGTHPNEEGPTTESSPTEVKRSGALDASVDAPVVVASPDASVNAAPVDASPDVATKSPGAGKIACGSEQCPVAANSHCCADYVNPQFYCASPSHTIGWCTGGGGRAVFCDEQADCATGQVCCEKGDVTSCSATCDGGKALP